MINYFILPSLLIIQIPQYMSVIIVISLNQLSYVINNSYISFMKNNNIRHGKD